MTASLIALVAIIVLTTGTAAWLYLTQPSSAQIRQRIGADPTDEIQPLFVSDPGTGLLSRIGQHLQQLLPSVLMTKRRAERLTQAGFTVPTAPALYLAAQIASVIVVPVVLGFLANLWIPWTVPIALALGIIVGLLLPPAFVARRHARWKSNIQRAIPDALDLLLVCVEAGTSLDMAFLRVGRELRRVHPDLANELLIVNRKQNAGMPRDEALRGLADRTELPEVRTLMSNIIQSEQWGTSITRVLRVESEALRRQRQTVAERRAAVVSTKMLLPLALLILPALFAVVGGPAIIQIQQVFNAGVFTR